MATHRGWWRNTIECLFELNPVGGERLYQVGFGVVSHHRDLIRWLQTIESFTRRPMHLITVSIKTHPLRATLNRVTAIDEQHHRERQLVRAKVRDLLFRAVFVKLEVLSIQPSDNASSILLHHERIDLNQVSVDLDDVIA